MKMLKISVHAFRVATFLKKNTTVGFNTEKEWRRRGIVNAKQDIA